ncbi:hypothetical protein BDR07DRAFT_1376595 [Suillus spraguei]|nr:hypothetical protein BDR07DRAFT_1376595 [Suillus spraguei]
MTSTETPNPGHPEGAGGKDTRSFNQPVNNLLSDEYILRIALSLTKNKQRHINLHDREAIEEENITCAKCNLKRANQRRDENYIEEVSKDEHFLDESDIPE